MTNEKVIKIHLVKLFLLSLLLIVLLTNTVYGVFYCDIDGQVFYVNNSSVGTGVEVNLTIIDGNYNQTSIVVETQDGGPSCGFCDNYYSASFVGDTQCGGSETVYGFATINSNYAVNTSTSEANSVVSMNLRFNTTITTPEPNPDPDPTPPSGPGGGGGGGGGGPPPEPEPEPIPPRPRPPRPPLPIPTPREEPKDELCTIEGYALYNNGTHVEIGTSVLIKFNGFEKWITTRQGPPPDYTTGYFSETFSECIENVEIYLEAKQGIWKGSNTYSYSRDLDEVLVVLDKIIIKELMPKEEIPIVSEYWTPERILAYTLAFIIIILLLIFLWILTFPGDHNRFDLWYLETAKDRLPAPKGAIKKALKILTPKEILEFRYEQEKRVEKQTDLKTNLNKSFTTKEIKIKRIIDDDQQTSKTKLKINSKIKSKTQKKKNKRKN
ncbi:hypothetical protein HOK51_06135 [Candidatus Woesearchaeota archaeon]|jgi:hypothetical protein|nr:hypothetical protein [Candidatus Woesearchaeota archaeon]MBT6519404.1 hypothetical protein [Candidatus Woesearchaeota archaeon]MBT7368076.1 hypothetical protein [Candidatus Woesearchaeota archaeon]